MANKTQGLDKAKLEDYYLNQKLTEQQIADIYGCCKRYIHTLRHQWNITTLSKFDRYDFHLDKNQEQVIIGGLLGDAWLSTWRPNKSGIKEIGNGHVSFGMAQGNAQKDYLLWKYDKISHLFHRDIHFSKRVWQITTYAHPYFSRMRQNWYPIDKKIVYLDDVKKLNAIGLAIWYMDDGSIKSKWPRSVLCTQGFSYEDVDLLIKILKDNFDLNTNLCTTYYKEKECPDIQLSTKCSEKPYISFSNTETKKLSDIVKPYMCPSMTYKLWENHKINWYMKNDPDNLDKMCEKYKL